MNRIIRYQIYWFDRQNSIRKSMCRNLHVRSTRSSSSQPTLLFTRNSSKFDLTSKINDRTKIQKCSYSVYYDHNRHLNVYRISPAKVYKYKGHKRYIVIESSEDLPSRNFCRVTDSKLSALYIDGIFDFFDGDHDPLEDLRNILYPKELNKLPSEEAENDPLYRLSHAKSVNDLLNAFSEIDQNNLTAQHSAQAVSTMRHLQKLSALPINYLNEDDFRIAQIEFNRLLMYEPIFDSILDNLKNHYSNLDTNILAYVFQCLRRLEQPLTTPLMAKLEVHLRKQFGKINSESLSYFATGLSGRISKTSKFHGNSLRKALSLAPAVPQIEKYIAEMDSPKDVYQVSICISMMNPLISHNCMVKFYQKLNQIIDSGKFRNNPFKSKTEENVLNSNDFQVSALVKVLSIYLTKKDWHLARVETLRNVLYLLKGRFDLLRPDQLVIVGKVAYDLGEPATILYELDSHIRKLFELQTASDVQDKEVYYMSANREDEFSSQSNDDPNSNSANTEVMHNAKAKMRSYIPKVDFLHSMVQARLGKVDDNIARNLVIETIESQLFPVYISQIFDIIRNTFCGNEPSIVKEFLHRSFEVCSQDMVELCRLGSRYINFNSSMGGVIRDHDFETKVIEVFKKDVLVNPYPVEFAAELGFLLSYTDDIDPKVLDRFHFMLPQLRPFHIYNIARGLETRFLWIPKILHSRYKSKSKYQAQTWETKRKRSTSRTSTIESSKRYFVDNEEMERILSEIDVSLSKQSLKLFNIIAEKVSESEHLDSTYTDCLSEQTYLHSARDFPEIYILFRNYISRRAYLDKEGFNIMVDRMVQYLEHSQLTSSVIRQTAVSLCSLRPQHDLSSLIDRMVTYLLDNRKHVHIHTLMRPLHLVHNCNDNILDSSKGIFQLSYNCQILLNFPPPTIYL